MRLPTWRQGTGEQVNGLEAVAEGLWLCDQRNNHAYLVDYQGRVLRKFPARRATPAALLWRGLGVDRLEHAAVAGFSHDALGHCLAYLTLAGEGGVHGLQWRPYAADERVPSAAVSGEGCIRRRPRGVPTLVLA